MQRNDFVSNSSSSSFIVINDTNIKEYNFNGEHVLVPSENGNCEFGWQWETYTDFWSKLNFCVIQLLDIKSGADYAKEILEKHEKSNYNTHWFETIGKHKLKDGERFQSLAEMLTKVCREKFNLNIEFRYNVGYSDGGVYAYIDHQSSASEGVNMEMFESESNLIDFLSSDDSYIKTGNDNDEPPTDDWYNTH